MHTVVLLQALMQYLNAEEWILTICIEGKLVVYAEIFLPDLQRAESFFFKYVSFTFSLLSFSGSVSGFLYMLLFTSTL